MKGKSKFDYDIFTDGLVVVNAQIYTKEQAIAIFVKEIEPEPSDFFYIGTAFVTWRAGITEDYEPIVGWWIDEAPYKRSCPVWILSDDDYYGSETIFMEELNKERSTIDSGNAGIC